MSIDLHKSAVHVAPKRGRYLRDGGRKTHFRCHRCRRDLPDDQFAIIDWSTDRSVAFLHPHCYVCRRQMQSEFGSWCTAIVMHGLAKKEAA